MKNFLKKIGRIFLKALLWFVAVSIVSIIIFRFVPVPLTPLMLIRCGEQVVNGEKIKLKKDWEPLENISPNLQLAVFCSEDQNFIEHHGFDLDAIEKALKHNEKSKRKHGASTISQQTAKNVFLWPGRSWIRKGFEVYFTLLIELLWNKERIMEVYLNVIEMGNGIYGAEAAAQNHFKKKAKNLSMRESALIAAVLPNPRKWSPSKPIPYIIRRQNFIVEQMYNYGKMTYDLEKK
jgi:monofunctional biosynthetic peptidoglycan transglycosylase